tara:strand:- start:36 stop:401 length:366 start_codon:yes stop_codon:yes gene_type:complete
MKSEFNKPQNQIDELKDISELTYERIFHMYKDGDHYAYNILRSIKLPADLDDDIFFYTRISGRISWTHLSMQVYNTIRLWWLICLTNGIMNPVILPEPGMVIKIIKPKYVKHIISSISSQL